VESLCCASVRRGRSVGRAQVPDHPTAGASEHSSCNPPSTDFASTTRPWRTRYRDCCEWNGADVDGGSGTPGPKAMCGRELLYWATQAIAPHGANQPFAYGICHRTPPRRFENPQPVAPDGCVEVSREDAIPIVEQKAIVPRDNTTSPERRGRACGRELTGRVVGGVSPARALAALHSIDSDGGERWRT
jgi:hypothetical protein